jgi:hypothetical protein
MATRIQIEKRRRMLRPEPVMTTLPTCAVSDTSAAAGLIETIDAVLDETAHNECP